MAHRGKAAQVHLQKNAGAYVNSQELRAAVAADIRVILQRTRSGRGGAPADRVRCVLRAEDAEVGVPGR